MKMPKYMTTFKLVEYRQRIIVADSIEDVGDKVRDFEDYDLWETTELVSTEPFEIVEITEVTDDEG